MSIQKQQYLPTLYTGCQLWMDAADTSSLTLSGSTVTAWRDKSGKGNNATANGAPQVSPAGIITTMDTTPGNNFYINSLTQNITGSVISVCFVVTVNQFTGSGLSWQYGRIVSFGDGTSSDFTTDDFTICQNENNESISFYSNGGSLVTLGITYGVPFLFTVILDGTNINFFLNGISQYSTTLTKSLNITQIGLGVNIATKTWPNDCLQGIISEVIVYNTVLLDAQRQQLEINLAQKWGLSNRILNIWTRPLYLGNSIFTVQNNALTQAGTIVGIPTYIKVGLAFYLDAGNSSSYSGSGSTWYDLAGSGVTTTLYNSPSYSSANGGYLSFSPSSSQYAQTSGALSSLSNWSLEVWHYFTNTNTYNANSCIITQVYEGSSINFNLGNTSLSQSGFTVGYFSGNWYSTRTDYALPSVGWYHIVGTYDGTNIKLYVNNSLIDTVASATASSSGGNPTRFMRRWDNAEFWGGALAVVRIYNRALEAHELEANYFWGRGRFGL